MTEQTCIICVGNWPQKDHLISDVGLTRAYLFQDQFFAGWTVLVLKQHIPELFKLSKGARSRMMEEVSRVAKTLARIFDAE